MRATKKLYELERQQRDEICHQLLKDEIIPALGCTEPGTIAYAAACAKEVLGTAPAHIDIWVSGNMLKNVKSVIIPNTGDLKGIAAAAFCGIVGGDPRHKLEVLNTITNKEVEAVRKLLEIDGMYTINLEETKEPLYVRICLYAKGHTSEVEIQKTHIHITKVYKDHDDITQQYQRMECVGNPMSRDNNLKLKDYYEFSCETDLDQLEELLRLQIEYNEEIAREGIRNDYGAKVGQNFLQLFGNDGPAVLAAYAAAGSDARMGGSCLPVVTNSGSGNQGITIAVPVALYAEKLNKNKEELYRALLFANLVSIYIKMDIGKLSAFCGAVNAGCAAACGIAYLDGASLEIIGDIITNTLATISGIICDGAKPSCASKIAMSVQTGLLAYEMAKKGCRFREGEGIVGKNVDETIEAIGKIAKDGMRETDSTILGLMMRQEESI